MTDNKTTEFNQAAADMRRDADVAYIRSRVLAKFPLLGVTMADIHEVPSRSTETAAIDGKNLYYNPKFFDGLSEEQRIFVYTHEIMHVAFDHITRSRDRNREVWNIATDAVINQILVDEGLPMVEGGVIRPDAINKSAEQVYDEIMQERDKQKQKSQQQQSSNQNPAQQPSADNPSEGDKDQAQTAQNQAGHDDHRIWDDVLRDHDRQKNQNAQQPQSADDNRAQGQDAPDRDFNNWDRESDEKFERGFLEKNRTMRSEMAAAARQSIQDRQAQAMQAPGASRTFGDVGTAPAVVDWRRLLRQTLERDEDAWSYRRSSADNYYMARMETIEVQERAQVEVMLDVSGSVSDSFLREFLRQLRPLLKNAKLRVGCFESVAHPFVDIKSNRDIDNFHIPAQGGTNWDAAVRAFTPRRDVSKIVFTDGEEPGQMPGADLALANVIWVVYGNDDFQPNCGRVIRVSPANITHFIAPPVHTR